MGYLKKTLFLIFFSLSISIISIAQKAIEMSDINTIYSLDSSNFVCIDTFPSTKTYNKSTHKYIYNKSPNKYHWYKLSIKNNNPLIDEWLMVSYNYAIDNLNIIVVSKNGTSINERIDLSKSVYEREICHKQPVFRIPIQYKEQKDIYIQLKNEVSHQFVFAFYSNNNFISDFFKEYLIYGLFYGFMAFVFLFCLFNYMFFRDKVMLIYTIFLLNQTIFMLLRDGNGLYILPYFSAHIDLYKLVFKAFVTTTLLLYVINFFKISKTEKMYKLLFGLIFFRLFILIIELFNNHPYSDTIDIIIISICTYISIKKYNKKSEIKYISYGFIFLCVSFYVYYISTHFIHSLNSLGFWGVYYGVAFESIFMTIAITERYKRTSLENFKQNSINTELSKMVKKRTKTITIQNIKLTERTKELDRFLYSIAHDIKGPFKTIIGLCHLILLDRSNNTEKLILKILRSISNLEFKLKDINTVIEIKKSDLILEKIDFQVLHDDIILTINPINNNYEILLDIKLTKEIQLDKFVISTIYKNLLSSIINLLNFETETIIKINISSSDNELKLIFEDNGLGIKKELVSKIFDMFYKVNNSDPSDTGLGLYIVKMSLEKIDGKISIETEEGKGSIITISIPLTNNIKS